MEFEGFIDFVLVSDVQGMHFEPHQPQGIEFNPTGNDNLRFVLQPTRPDEDASGHRLGLTCKVYKSYQATKDQMSFVSSYNDKRVMLRVADGITLPYKSREETLITEDGSCKSGYSPPRNLCPADILELIEMAESDLSEQVDRFFKLLRWRQYCNAPSEVLKHRSLYWRVGNGDYPIAPLDGAPSREVTVKAMFGIHWSDRHSNDLQDLWQEKGILEPLGHTLLREAAALSHESPRSSILIMTAALETAVKTHISRIAPDTAWLMEETPSPPVFKILKDYIPLIHRSHGTELDFWDKVKPSLKNVQKLIETRNKIAHTGKIPYHVGPIQDFIELVSDFLYLIDVLDGHEWAKTLVGYSLRKSLGWPDPKDGRVFITISEEY